MLICPNCQSLLSQADNIWRCPNHHAFDVGKQGDVNLLLPQQKRSKSPGDSKEMVAARRDFLASGAYQPIAETLAKTVIMLSQGLPVRIADAGCGEGYYLRQMKRLCYPQSSAGADFVGWDISKFAVQSAAKQSAGQGDVATWLTASNAHIPLADNSVDILLSLFGFEVADEFARVVEAGGFVVTADASERHLIEIRERIYPALKPYQEKPLLNSDQLRYVKSDCLNYQVTLNQAQLRQLLLMTPHFFRATADKKAHLASLPMLSVTVDVQFRIYRQTS